MAALFYMVLVIRKITALLLISAIMSVSVFAAQSPVLKICKHSAEMQMDNADCHDSFKTDCGDCDCGCDFHFVTYAALPAEFSNDHNKYSHIELSTPLLQVYSQHIYGPLLRPPIIQL